MTTTYAYDEQPSSGHPLRPGASPRAIRAALLSADRVRFDAAYEVVLAESRESLDLAGLFTMLEHCGESRCSRATPRATGGWCAVRLRR